MLATDGVKAEGTYGSFSYLVIDFDGREKAYRFLREENLDALLDAFRVKTDIPVGNNN